MAIRGIILEGVTGAGKTRTLRAIEADPQFPSLLGDGPVFAEAETYGEFMDEIRSPNLPPGRRFARLGRVLRALRRACRASESPARTAPTGYVLERFHPSYFALAPDWSRYRRTDLALRALRCGIVLLSFDPRSARDRALNRPDRGDGWPEAMIDYFGSRLRSALRKRGDFRVVVINLPWFVQE